MRDLKGRYVGSMVGIFWSVINPLITLALYTLVFSFVLKVKLGPEGSPMDFVERLLCGLLPWVAFQESITRSSTVIIENSSLIKKMRFPSEILPVNVALSSFVYQLIGTAVLVFMLLVVGDLKSPYIALLPFAFLLQLSFTVGLGWAIASLNVFFRDIGQMLGVIFNIWFFLTPIVYPKDMAPKAFRMLLELNPMTHMVELYRALILDARAPSIFPLAFLAASAAASFGAGYAIFRRTRMEFADVV